MAAACTSNIGRECACNITNPSNQYQYQFQQRKHISCAAKPRFTQKERREIRTYKFGAVTVFTICIVLAPIVYTAYGLGRLQVVVADGFCVHVTAHVVAVAS
jgi:hypothetical protein